ASTWMCCRKARPRLTDLPGRMPGKRQAGCRFLLGTSLLDKQKRSASASEGGRKLFALHAMDRSIAREDLTGMSDARESRRAVPALRPPSGSCVELRRERHIQ